MVATISPTITGPPTGTGAGANAAQQVAWHKGVVGFTYREIEQHGYGAFRFDHCACALCWCCHSGYLVFLVFCTHPGSEHVIATLPTQKKGP